MVPLTKGAACHEAARTVSPWPRPSEQNSKPAPVDIRHRIAMSCVTGSCSTRPTVSGTTRSPPAVRRGRSSASGESGFPTSGWPDWTDRPPRTARVFPRRRGRDQGAGLRMPGEGRQAAAAGSLAGPDLARAAVEQGSSPRSRGGRSGGGSAPTRSSRGSTAAGYSPATHSDSRPDACWTCTPALRGQSLRADEYVISADEKTFKHARIASTHHAPGTSEPARVEAEYVRRGVLAYLAAWDVRRAKVFGRCEQTTGIDPYDRLVDLVMSTRHTFPRDGCSGSPTTARPTAERPATIGPGSLAETAPGPPARARELAEPGGDLLLRRAPKSPSPDDFADVDAVEADCSASSRTTSSSPHRSSGSSQRRPERPTQAHRRPRRRRPHARRITARRIRHRNSVPDH